MVPDGVDISGCKARPGDSIIVSGTLGDHGVAIMSLRENLGFDTGVTSDSAPLHTLVEHKYYVDELYDRVFVRPGFALARFINAIIEPRVIDGLVNGVASFFVVEAREFRLIQTGRVRSYGLVMLVGALGTVFLVVLFLGYLPVKLGG